MENISKPNMNKNLKAILIGSTISILTTIFLLFLFAMLLSFTTLNEKFMTAGVIIISSISILIGSGISTIKISKKGLINGGIIGFIYIAFIYILSSTAGTGFNLTLNSIILIICSIIAGMLGGIIGVNIK